jgi:hypothetical protein
MTTGESDLAGYFRGRLHIAGVDADTPVGTVLDVLMTIVIDTPRDALEQWRRKFDPLIWKIRPPDRDTWGLRPDQQAQMAKAAGLNRPQ